MKCLAPKKATASRATPNTAFSRMWTFLFVRRARTAGFQLRYRRRGHGGRPPFEESAVASAQPSDRFCDRCKQFGSAGLAVAVFELLEPGDHAEAAEEHLVRARVVAHVMWLAGAVGEVGDRAVA